MGGNTATLALDEGRKDLTQTRGGAKGAEALCVVE